MGTGKDPGDRGALIALGMLLAAVLVVAAVTSWPRYPTDTEIRGTDTYQVNRDKDGNVTQRVAQSNAPLGEKAEPDEPHTQRQESGNQDHTPSFSVPVSVIEYPRETEADKRREQESDQRGIEDLAAQKSMAKGTEEIVWLSKLQLALAFVGTVALLWSLRLNRQATKAAIDMVKVERTRSEPLIYLDRDEKLNVCGLTTFRVGNGSAVPCVITAVSVRISHLEGPPSPTDYPPPTFAAIVLNPFSTTEIPHDLKETMVLTRGEVIRFAAAGMRQWFFGWIDFSCVNGRYRFGFCGSWELYNETRGHGRFTLSDDKERNYCEKT